MKTEHLTIGGMSCSHCVAHLKGELGKLPGVTVRSCDVGNATVEFDESSVSRSEIAGAVARAGYELVSARPA